MGGCGGEREGVGGVSTCARTYVGVRAGCGGEALKAERLHFDVDAPLVEDNWGHVKWQGVYGYLLATLCLLPIDATSYTHIRNNESVGNRCM